MGVLRLRVIFAHMYRSLGYARAQRIPPGDASGDGSSDAIGSGLGDSIGVYM